MINTQTSSHTNLCKKLVFIDATTSALNSLSLGTEKVMAEFGAKAPKVIARSPDDLFDTRQIERCVEQIKTADALVFLLHGGTSSIPGITDLVEAASGKLVHVQTSGMMTQEELDFCEAYCTEFRSDSFQNRYDYMRRGGAENYKNLLITICRDLGDTDFPVPAEPMAQPTEGIYHSEYSGDMKDRDGYLSWQRERLGLGPDAPIVGLWFYQHAWVNNDLAVIDALNAEIESRGAIPLSVFHFRMADPALGAMPVADLVEHFFKADGSALISVLLSLTSFSLTMSNKKLRHIMPGLDVPVLHGINTYNPRKEWRDTLQGISPIDVSVNVAQPEFDGDIVTTVVGTRDHVGIDPITGAQLVRFQPVPDRVSYYISMAMNWVRLQRVPPADRKIVMLFHNYPPTNANLGAATGLDSFQSVNLMLQRLKEDGHTIEKTYEKGDDLANELLDCLTNDRRFLQPEQLAARAEALIDQNTTDQWHSDRTAKVRQEMDEQWGTSPGPMFTHDGQTMVGGMRNGNVFLAMQPHRGMMVDEHEPTVEQNGKMVHDPYLPPSHQYLNFYRWLKDDFGAHVICHIGTHGSLEWLPGKSCGLSEDCYPFIAISDLPHLYPYIVNNPGEGTQTKRRSNAVIIDYFIPGQTNAGKYEPLMELEQLLDDAHIAEMEDPSKVPVIVESIWEKVCALNLDKDLGVTREEIDADPEPFLDDLHGYLNKVALTAINDGMHTFGVPPEDKKFNETLVQLVRQPSGEDLCLSDAVALAFGFDGEDLRDNPGVYVPEEKATKGQIHERVLAEILKAFQDLDEKSWTQDSVAEVVQARFHNFPAVKTALDKVAEVIRPGLMGCTDEMKYFMRGIEGRFVPPGSSGSPTRGRIDVMPTGRNFCSIDPYRLPTKEAWEVGVRLGDSLVAQYKKDEGKYPEQVGIPIWATVTMRTRGDCLAEILYLMGVRPVWEGGTGRIRGLELIPLAERTFPRLDVTVHASGLFRDTFPNLMELIDQAARMVAALDEPPEMNFLARNVAVEVETLIKQGIDPKEAAEQAAVRMFSEKPGTYGSGVSELLDSGKWEDVTDLGETYISWCGYAYGKGVYGKPSQDSFRNRMTKMDVTVQNLDTFEYDLFSCDDYNGYQGGMNAAVHTAAGKPVKRAYNGNSNDPRKVETISNQDMGRFVFRTRVLNPKWIDGMKRHGYKGAGDFAKLVDYIFQWDATSSIIEDWQYEELAKTYVLNKEMQDFFAENNPYAMQNIIERLLEAIRRGLWENPGDLQDELETQLLEAEGLVEDGLHLGHTK